MARDGWEVCAKTFAVCIGASVAAYLIAQKLGTLVPNAAFRWAAGFAAVQAAAVGALSLRLLAMRTYGRLNDSLSNQIRPAVRDSVLTLAFEGEAWTSEMPAHGLARRVLEACVVEALTGLKGPPRDRVARFSEERGFVAEWRKAFASRSQRRRKHAISLLGLVASIAGRDAVEAALKDKDAGVRVEACRALISQDTDAVEAVFASMLRESLLTRALLAADLKQYARRLLDGVVPQLLEEASAEEAARCFEILIAWKRALPSFDVHRWLAEKPDHRLWPLLLALLPYVPVDGRVEEYVAEAFSSGDRAVRCAAAKAAGELKLKGMVPRLRAALSEDKELALAAASALAQMGEAGERSLDEAVLGANRSAALVAMEALERVTVRVH